MQAWNKSFDIRRWRRLEKQSPSGLFHDGMA